MINKVADDVVAEPVRQLYMPASVSKSLTRAYINNALKFRLLDDTALSPLWSHHKDNKHLSRKDE